MTLHVLHNGDGYTYLTRQVAAHDKKLAEGHALADYYTAHGYPAGVWMGGGAASLGASGEVSESQMKALFGNLHHPDADAIAVAMKAEGRSDAEIQKAIRLGRKLPSYEMSHALVDRLAEGYRRANVEAGRPAGTPLSEPSKQAVRREVVSAMFREEHGRAPTAGELRRFAAGTPTRQQNAVAGYDLVFTPVKSVAVLWGLSSDQVRREIAAAHNAAVADTIKWIEQNAIYTRAGKAGVEQIDAGGVIAASFVHFDSRAGDPDLHTHVAIANRVQGSDGKWRSIDGRALFPAAVTASERYNTQLEDELRARLGARFAPRSGQDGKRDVRELVGVPPELVRAFSKRRQTIEDGYDAAVAEYVSRHGQAPTRQARWQLYQQATLANRPDKDQVRPLRTMVEDWRAEAESLVGGDVAARLEAAVVGRNDPLTATQDLDGAARELLAVMEDSRSSWTRNNVRAEAARLSRGWVVNPAERDRIVDELTDRALDAGAGAVALVAPSPQIPEPDYRTRADGTSVLIPAGRTRWTTRSVLAAEERIVTSGHRTAGLAVDDAVVNRAIVASTLTAGQQELVRGFTTDHRETVLGLAPAGTGKTTAMKMVTQLWQDSGRKVVQLAPSAAAAAVLSQELGCEADTIDAHEWHQRPIEPGSMLLVDEAGMVSTKLLDQVVTRAHAAGAVVRLIGDDRQLGAVQGGGAVRLLAQDCGALTMSQVMRFVDPGEAHASLQVRRGEQAALAWYQDHDRVSEGNTDEMRDAAYAAWSADRGAGRTSLLMAGDQDTVDALNQRARADRVLAGEVDSDSIAGRGGSRFGLGDHVATRRNDRRIQVCGGKDFVKNGDGWVVVGISDGEISLVHREHQGRATVTREWAATHLELDYARTVHRAQGLTVDRAHLIVDPMMGRSGFYVGTTRGRENNQLWVATHNAPEPGHVPDPPLSAHEVLSDVLGNNDVEESATQTLRDELAAAEDLGRMITHYDATAAAIAEHRYRAIAEEVAPGLAASDTWSLLSDALNRAERDGWQAERLLRWGAQTDLEAADDPAALLAWRIAKRVDRLDPPPQIRPVTPAMAARYNHMLAGGGVDDADHERWRPVRMTLAAAERHGCPPAQLAQTLADGARTEPKDLARRIDQVRQEHAAKDRGNSAVPVWLVPLHQHEVAGSIEDRALTQRRAEIGQRITELVDQVRQERPAWAAAVAAAPRDRLTDVTLARMVAYRQQYRITGDDPGQPLGPKPEQPGRQQAAWLHTRSLADQAAAGSREPQQHRDAPHIDLADAPVVTQSTPVVDGPTRGPRLGT